MIEQPVSNYTPAVKLLNTNNDDCTFQYGKLPDNTIFEASSCWLQKRTKEFENTLHPAPRVQYVVTLKGKLKFTVTDGRSFVIEPGIIIVAADTKGVGHSWKMIDGEAWERLYIPVPDGNEKYFIPDLPGK
ncbi:MAG: hypothetical protein ABIU63_18030 [Chitinophagaceae bacterium]